METDSHRSNDRRKLLKLPLLRGQERRPFEEGNHVRQKVIASSNDVDQHTVLPSIGLDVAASVEPATYQLKDLAPVTVLADMKLRNQLIAATACRIAIDGDCKTALAINIARDVAIQPFLLIVRTRHIFTVPPTWDGTRSAGYSDVPAYSRVLQLPRSTDSYGRRLPGLSFAASGQALTTPRNLPAPGRRQPLYVVLRLSRDLCFW